MLRALFKASQVLILGLAGYNAVTALWGWRNRDPAPPGPRSRRMRVVVPAHNEAGVITDLLSDLASQDYPPDLTDVWVIADRCTDATAEVASVLARVAVRREGEGGKGEALAWYLADHPLARDEALVVFDADNRVPRNVLARFADEFDAGHDVLQAYLDVTNPDASPLATASALSYWAGNRMVQLARTNLGWSADLGGTGMAFTAAALERAGGFAGSLTEDQELAARLALAGEKVEWLHDVKIRDEKPAGTRATVGQRSRWMAGKRAVARAHAGRLFVSAIERRSPRLLDHTIRLVQPGRTFVALASGLFTVGAVVTSGWFLPWQLWASATAAQVLQPIPFLARDGVPLRYLIRYPYLTLLAGLWVPIRYLSRTSTDWYHTRHGDTGDRVSGTPPAEPGRQRDL